jgi:glycosyltransferase involved in cell wall biosynthesis
MPIITCDVDGLSEQVADTFGVKTAVADPSQLAAAICKLAESDLTKLGTAARASVANHHEEHLKAWSQLLRRHAPTAQLADAA